MQIDRCYCFDRRFSDLKKEAELTGATTVEQLLKGSDFGRKCRLCHPYVRRMLRTGETVFRHIITDEDEPEPPPGS